MIGEEKGMGWNALFSLSVMFPGNVYAFTRNSGRLGCCTEREVVFSLVMIFWNVGCFLQFVVFSQGFVGC